MSGVTFTELQTSSFALPLPARFRGRVTENQRVLAGIRPEHPRQRRRRRADRGHETIVYASAGGERLVAIFNPEATPRAGETIAMTVTAEAMHLFDAETSENLR
jgi:ABC-type sugar transport system ATPase subunit